MHRQRVHISAQADRGLAVAIPQHADDAGLADTAMHLDAPFLEFPGDEVGGAVLLQAQFGVGVDVVADGDELILILAGSVDNGSGHRVCPDGSDEERITWVRNGQTGRRADRGAVMLARTASSSFVCGSEPSRPTSRALSSCTAVGHR